MKNKLQKIVNSPTMMEWSNNIVVFAHGIIVTPLTLKKLDDIEYSYWILLQTLLGMSLLVDSGFGHTLGRTVSFLYSGAKQIPNNLAEFKKMKGSKGEPNYILLHRLLTTSARIYTLVSIFTVVILAGVGLLVLRNLLEMSGNDPSLWLAFVLMLIMSFISIQGVKWNSYMMGCQQVAIQNQISTLSGVFQLFAFLGVLVFYPNINLLLGILMLKTIISLYIRKHKVLKKINLKNEYKFIKTGFDKELFKPLWRSTWRLGASQWGSFFTKSGTSIVISQIKNPALMASFLFTNRILEFIQKIANGPFRANIPVFYSLMAEKNYPELKKKISGVTFMMIIMFLVGITTFGLLGNTLLDWLTIEKSLVPISIYVVLGATLLIDSHSRVHGTVYIGTNSVPFYIPSIITGGLMVLIGFLILPHYGLLGVVTTKLLLILMFNAWFSVYLDLKLINWKLLDYAKDIIVKGSAQLSSAIKKFFK